MEVVYEEEDLSGHEDGGERMEVRGGTRRRARRMGARRHHTRRMEAAFKMEVVFEEDDGGRRGGWRCEEARSMEVQEGRRGG